MKGKKILSAVCALAMACGSLAAVPASAAADSYENDFSGFGAYGANTTSFLITNRDGNVDFAVEAKGVGGKANSDSVLRMYTDTAARSSKELSPYTQASINKTIDSGENIHISFELLNESKAFEKDIMAVYNHSERAFTGNFIRFATNGKLVIGSTQLDYKTNKWYKFDIVMRNGSTTADIYVDGELAAKAMELFAGGLTGLEALRFSYARPAATGTPVRDGWDMDNFSWKISTTEPEIEKVETVVGFDAEFGSYNDIPAHVDVNYNIAGERSFPSAAGVYGKSAGDVCFDISSKATAAYNMIYYWENTTQSFNDGDKVHLTFNMATDSLATQKHLSMLLYDTNYSSATKKEVRALAAMEPNGTFSALGNDVNYTAQTGKWYRIDVVITAKSGSLPYDLYIDGEKAGTYQYKGAGLVDKPIMQFRLGYNSNAATAENMYIDDIHCREYKAEDTAYDPALKLTLANGLWVSGKDISPVSDTMTIADFKAANSDVDVIDAAGTGLLLGNTVVYTPSKYGKMYFNTVKNKTYFSDEFENSTTFAQNWTSGYNSTVEYKKIGGRQTNAYVLTNSGIVENREPILQLYPNITGDMTMEISLLAEKIENNLHKTGVSVCVNGGSAAYLVDVVKLEENGDITVNDQKVGTWKENRWYNFAVSFHIGSDKIDAYMNGEKVIDGEKLCKIPGNSGYVESIQRFKLGFYGAVGTKGISAFDDFAVYSGEYTTADNAASFTIEDYTVKGDRIIIGEDEEKDSFTSAITDGYYKIFTDSTLTEEVSDYYLTAGENVLVVYSANGKTLKYYKLDTLNYNYTMGDVSLSANGETTATLVNGAVTASCEVELNDNESAVMITALYGDDGKTLVDVKLTGITESGTASGTVTVTDAANQTLKVMLWKSMNTMIPAL